MGNASRGHKEGSVGLSLVGIIATASSLLEEYQKNEDILLQKKLGKGSREEFSDYEESLMLEVKALTRQGVSLQEKVDSLLTRNSRYQSISSMSDRTDMAKDQKEPHLNQTQLDTLWELWALLASWLASDCEETEVYASGIRDLRQALLPVIAERGRFLGCNRGSIGLLLIELTGSLGSFLNLHSEYTIQKERSSSVKAGSDLKEEGLPNRVECLEEADLLRESNRVSREIILAKNTLERTLSGAGEGGEAEGEETVALDESQRATAWRLLCSLSEIGEPSSKDVSALLAHLNACWHGLSDALSMGGSFLGLQEGSLGDQLLSFVRDTSSLLQDSDAYRQSFTKRDQPDKKEDFSQRNSLLARINLLYQRIPSLSESLRELLINGTLS